MRQSLIITVFALLVTATLFGQSERHNLYKLEIKNWGLLFGPNTTWTISVDSITITRKTFNGATEMYSKGLVAAEKEEIQSWLLKVNLDKINKQNVDNAAPDDMGEYDFKIKIGKSTKEFHVYQVKIDEVFNLVQQINRFLPDQYRIGYDDEYFRFKK